MQPDTIGGRARGQVLVIVALALTALIGITGVAIDLGFGYGHRREQQAAADAGAQAGAAALARHYMYSGLSCGSTPTPTACTGMVDWTDSMILAEIKNAAVWSVRAFATPVPTPDTTTGRYSSTLNWPSGGSNGLNAWYLLTNAASPPTFTQSTCQVGACTTIPANAAGIRVEAILDYPTLFARVLGDCCSTVTVRATARVVFYGTTPSGGTFAVCGRNVVTPVAAGTPAPNPGATGAIRRTPGPGGNTPEPILNPSTNKVDYATYQNKTYLLYDNNLPDAATCSASSNSAGWKGLVDQSAPCVPSSPPCQQELRTGAVVGPTGNTISGFVACDPSTLNNCAMWVAVASGCVTSGSGAACTVQDYAAVFVQTCTGQCYQGKLLPAAVCGAGCTPGGSAFNPTNPGVFSYGLVPDP
jgi:hypothetical protein